MYITEKSYVGPREVGRVTFDSNEQKEALCKDFRSLSDYGINIQEHHVDAMMQHLSGGVGMDAALNPLNPTTASITTPVQFLQAWLPGFVYDVTDARKIDEVVGVVTQGNWEDEEIVQGVMERTGEALPYTDYGNTSQSSWNVNYERRTIVRFEIGMTVGKLEEARAAAIRANSAESKRGASARELEIVRNRIGFNGYNAGANRTYGFLNDPSLPAYVNVPNGAGGSSTWASKTFQEIKNDLLAAAAALRVQSGERVDPTNDMITIAVATAAVDQLAQTTDFGVSVQEWVDKSYKNWRIVSAPELDAANAGDNVFYMFAESVSDSGSDDSRTFIQVVPSKFQTLGVDQNEKSYSEAYLKCYCGNHAQAALCCRTTIRGLIMSKYIYSTLSCDQAYTLYMPAKEGRDAPPPAVVGTVYVNGRANIADKNFLTPKGMLTVASEEDYALLQSSDVFKRHLEAGYIHVEDKKHEVDNVVKDMTEKDKSAPLTDGAASVGNEEMPSPKKRGRK